jgi:hypothetical protein
MLAFALGAFSEGCFSNLLNGFKILTAVRAMILIGRHNNLPRTISPFPLSPFFLLNLPVRLGTFGNSF